MVIELIHYSAISKPVLAIYFSLETYLLKFNQIFKYINKGFQITCICDYTSFLILDFVYLVEILSFPLDHTKQNIFYFHIFNTLAVEFVYSLIFL